MESINQSVLDNAIIQRERNLKISTYSTIGLGMAGMLFFMFSFVFNSHEVVAEAYLIGFIFTSLVFAFGISSLSNITFQSSTKRFTKNNFRKS